MAGEATEAELESLQRGQNECLSPEFGVLTAPDIMGFVTAETLPDQENLLSPKVDPSLPSFFRSLGWISETGLETLAQEGTLNATQTEGEKPPNATVIVWKDEFHVVSNNQEIKPH